MSRKARNRMMAGRARTHPSETVPGPGLGSGKPGSTPRLQITECRNCPGTVTGHLSGLCADCRKDGEQR